jgi:hypothetical protein
MEPNKILAPLQGLVPTLSGAYSCHYSLACVWALHVKLICQVCFFSLESFKLQTPLMEMKMTYYHGPLDNPSHGQPWSCRPFITPVSRKQLLNRLQLSLFLTVVRAVTERGHLKDRLREVKETLLPRKCPSASERHLSPQAMQKSYKNPIPTLTHWDHRFPGPPAFPIMQSFSSLLFSSLQIKSFRPLLLEPACAFTLRLGSRTLSTWNSCSCHLCIIFTS